MPTVSRIDFSSLFIKQFRKAPTTIQNAWTKRLQMFKQDRFGPQLNNHQLKGNFAGYRSINITGDWRAIYSEYKNKTGEITVIF